MVALSLLTLGCDDDPASRLGADADEEDGRAVAVNPNQKVRFVTGLHQGPEPALVTNVHESLGGNCLSGRRLDWRVDVTYTAQLDTAANPVMELSTVGVVSETPDPDVIISSVYVVHEGGTFHLERIVGGSTNGIYRLPSNVSDEFTIDSSGMFIVVEGGAIGAGGNENPPGEPITDPGCQLSTSLVFERPDEIVEQHTFDGESAWVRTAPIVEGASAPVFAQATAWTPYSPQGGSGTVRAFSGWTSKGAINLGFSMPFANYVYARGNALIHERRHLDGGVSTNELSLSGFPLNMVDMRALITYPVNRTASCPKDSGGRTTSQCLKFVYWGQHVGGSTTVPIRDADGEVEFPSDWNALTWLPLSYNGNSPGGRDGNYPSPNWGLSAGTAFIFDGQLRQNFWHDSNQGDGSGFSSQWKRDVPYCNGAPTFWQTHGTCGAPVVDGVGNRIPRAWSGPRDIDHASFSKLPNVGTVSAQSSQVIRIY
ncbi:MAG: hypothetical protein K0V04_45265 [Deltaproteobacteria bacterium]|nr:hypothetical protein [Deltaproteobacteria bacterium]